MITAFAKAGSALKESSYVERAIKAAAFLRENLYLPETGRLLRCCYRGLEEGSVTQKYVILSFTLILVFKKIHSKSELQCDLMMYH